MLTLSTFPNDTAGYTLFVDGQPVRLFPSEASVPGWACSKSAKPCLDPCMQPYQLEQTVGRLYEHACSTPHPLPLTSFRRRAA